MTPAGSAPNSSTTEVIGIDQLDRAVDQLAAGGLVAIPTETVYGLGADAASGPAVGAVFSAKGRPPGHPLIVHVHDLAAAIAITDEMSPAAVQLAEAFWPGPLTMVLNRQIRASEGQSLVAPETVGGRATVGVRVPDHRVTLELLTRFAEVGSGLVAAPSANRFGSVSPTTAAHVVADALPGVSLVVDGGSCRVGVESTIVDLTGSEPELLRPGGISMVELEAVIGTVHDGRSGVARAPGMLASHYAPATPVEVVEAETEHDLKLVLGRESEAAVGLVCPFATTHHPAWVLPSDAQGYAAGLYGALRSADMAGLDQIVVVPPRSGRLLEAVIDRLTKASA